MTIRIRAIKAAWLVFGSPNRDRLSCDIQQERIEFEGKSHDPELPWKLTAAKHLDFADTCVRECRLQEGWAELFAARRADPFRQRRCHSSKHRACAPA